ncbi:DNA cytosine methyltransferase [Listeria grandensis]|uniref:DNA cytosine methyltransferase n=1 Tax=Listeria grandensis TaxID=1494963 RepID=UPI00164D02CD|nr:DNA cytosine methyltransferase [Listeria grandensis]MBC6316462.1 DNA cytosine methyltransferase [Listeria grandensis]
MKNISVFSFFSGSGFLDLGFEKSGFSVVEVNEYFEPFIEAYKYSRKNLELAEPKFGYSLGSIGDYVGNMKFKDRVEIEKENNIVGFIGGPPCPDFSVAGKNRGREGENGQLTQTYFDLIIQELPDFFVFENVKGLWKTKKHNLFYNDIKKQAEDAGYIIIDSLLNALQFDVPQDRERIFMIGILRETLSIVESEIVQNFNWGIKHNSIEKIKLLNWPETNIFQEDNILRKPKNINEVFTVEYWFKKNGVYIHPNANEYFKPRQALNKFYSIEEGDISKKSFKRLHRWRYSPTAAYGNNEVHLHPYKPRRISVAEALAIQSLPQDFILPPTMTLTNKFKTIGNGVPFEMSKGIAGELYTFLNKIFL